MRLALVTTFPPSEGTLNYYGFYLAEGYCQRADISEVAVIADQVSRPEVICHPKLSIQRCWRINNLLNSLLILRAVQKARPDVVHFNIHTGFQFGSNRVAHGLGLLSPVLVGLAGYKTLVTLHDFIELVDLSRTMYGGSWVNRLAAHWLVKLIHTSANHMVFLSQRHREIFQHHYGAARLSVVPPWVLEPLHEDVRGPEKAGDVLRLLFFGYIARAKNVELLIDAFESLTKEFPHLELVVAGGDHPAEQPEYLQSLKKRLLSTKGVTLVDRYIGEEEQAGIFQGADLVVMPYKTTTGVSGVFHVACRYGLPVVASDLPEFRQLVEQGAGILVSREGSPAALVETLRNCILDADLRRNLGLKNLQLGRGATLGKTVAAYVAILQGIVKAP